MLLSCPSGWETLLDDSHMKAFHISLFMTQNLHQHIAWKMISSIPVREDLMKEATELHCGKCRIQIFWGVWPKLGTKGENISASLIFYNSCLVVFYILLLSQNPTKKTQISIFSDFPNLFVAGIDRNKLCIFGGYDQALIWFSSKYLWQQNS